MLVEEVMTTDVVTCDVDTSIRTAAELMLEHRIGSVVVCHEDTPTGIVTETDVLHAGYVTDRAFSKIPLKPVTSHPLITIEHGATLRRATDKMKRENVKKLPVVEDMDLVGIVTTQDVIRHYPDLKAEVHKVVQEGARRQIGRDLDADARGFDADDV